MTEIIINNINKYIEKNFIKQTWIADSLGVGKMNISNILNGKKRNITLEELNDIIDVLDLKFEDVSKADFDFEDANNIYIREDRMESEYLALCGEITNEKTKENIGLITELIDLMEVFKKANSFNLHFSSFKDGD